MKFYGLALELHLPQNFLTFSKNPKMCKLIKNQKSKIFVKIIFLSINADEYNNIEDNNKKYNQQLDIFINYEK